MISKTTSTMYGCVCRDAVLNASRPKMGFSSKIQSIKKSLENPQKTSSQQAVERSRAKLDCQIMAMHRKSDSASEADLVANNLVIRAHRLAILSSQRAKLPAGAKVDVKVLREKFSSTVATKSNARIESIKKQNANGSDMHKIDFTALKSKFENA